MIKIAGSIGPSRAIIRGLRIVPKYLTILSVLIASVLVGKNRPDGYRCRLIGPALNGLSVNRPSVV
jgi:hypothetical protein